MPTEMTRTEGLRRRTWGLRMAVYVALFMVMIVGVIYVLTRSNNGGESGEPSRFAAVHRFETADFHSLAVDEEGTVLFGHHNGVQMSNDGGDTWSVLIDTPNWDAMSLAFDPFDPERVYLAGHNVYLISEDAGASWNEAGASLPGLDLHAFAVSPNDEGRLYAYSVGQGLYRSSDGGGSWDLVSSDVPLGTSALVELPDGTLLLAAADSGILRSADGGETWSASREGIDIGVIFTIKADPGGQRVYAGTDRGVFVSTDGGQSWTGTALDDIWATGIGVDPADPLQLYVINSIGYLYRSDDGGETW